MAEEILINFLKDPESGYSKLVSLSKLQSHERIEYLKTLPKETIESFLLCMEALIELRPLLFMSSITCFRDIIENVSIDIVYHNLFKNISSCVQCHLLHDRLDVWVRYLRILIKRNSFVEIEFLIDEILKISSDQEGSCFTADFQNRLFDLMSIPISEIDERVGDALLKLQKK
jgi:hypothetical protein